MKKVFSTLCCFSLLILGIMTLTGFAAVNSDDIAEIYNLKRKIVDFVDSTIHEGKEINIEEADINFDYLSKIYVDTDIFRLNLSSTQEVTNALNNSAYFYELPIYKDGFTIFVNISRIQSLTEEAKAALTQEEINYLTENVGAWDVVGFDIHPGVIKSKY